MRVPGGPGASMHPRMPMEARMMDEDRGPGTPPAAPGAAPAPTHDKRPYATPRLAVHGTIVRHTLGSVPGDVPVGADT